MSRKTVRWENFDPCVTDNKPHWEQAREESVEKREKIKLKPLTPNQGVYFEAIRQCRITLCTGPAGSGKTYLACGLAAQMLQEGKVSKIIVTRPLVSCGAGYGYRPGTVEEKVAPVMRPLLEALEDFLGKRELSSLMKNQTVEMWPMDDMRGANIRNAVLICDEAQNAEFEQLHMLLTRFAKGTKVVVCGDASQTDLKHGGPNPLLEVIRRFSAKPHPEISVVRLYREDIVRDPLIQWVDEALSESVLPTVGQSRPGETWYTFACPSCTATLWVNNGNENDPTTKDVERVCCWSCQVVSDVTEDGLIHSEDQHDDADASYARVGI